MSCSCVCSDQELDLRGSFLWLSLIVLMAALLFLHEIKSSRHRTVSESNNLTFMTWIKETCQTWADVLFLSARWDSNSHWLNDFMSICGHAGCNSSCEQPTETNARWCVSVKPSSRSLQCFIRNSISAVNFLSPTCFIVDRSWLVLKAHVCFSVQRVQGPTLAAGYITGSIQYIRAPGFHPVCCTYVSGQVLCVADGSLPQQRCIESVFWFHVFIALQQQA